MRGTKKDFVFTGMNQKNYGTKYTRKNARLANTLNQTANITLNTTKEIV